MQFFLVLFFVLVNVSTEVSCMEFNLNLLKKFSLKYSRIRDEIFPSLFYPVTFPLLVQLASRFFYKLFHKRHSCMVYRCFIFAAWFLLFYLFYFRFNTEVNFSVKLMPAVVVMWFRVFHQPSIFLRGFEVFHFSQLGKHTFI